MSNKHKGSNAERELIHLFWTQPNWFAIRVAGSGSMKYPAPDILAGTTTRKLCIECKISGENNIYLPTDEIQSLLNFSRRVGGETYIAFRFNHTTWKFLETHELKQTPTQYVITRETSGLSFEDVIRKEPKEPQPAIYEGETNEVDLS